MPNSTSRLSIIGLGLALGITWAISIFLLGIVAWLFGWGINLVHIIASLYVGYAPTFLGTIYGTIWGSLIALLEVSS